MTIIKYIDETFRLRRIRLEKDEESEGFYVQYERWDGVDWEPTNVGHVIKMSDFVELLLENDSNIFNEIDAKLQTGTSNA